MSAHTKIMVRFLFLVRRILRGIGRKLLSEPQTGMGMEERIVPYVIRRIELDIRISW